MKKKILFVLVLFLGLSSISLGQNFEPGEQAKGMSNMKNMSVDYSTGIFSYTIPLFELSSAYYRLPVSLVYTANGVKVEDKMGQLGFGWTLACGGVISRVVRGGMADEEGAGISSSSLLEEGVLERVNNRWQDGESDIYTAVFNGRNVSFIRLREGDKIVIKPLEKTNLLIEDIEGGFRITDENGIKYIFTSGEMSVGVCFQNSNSSANNIWNSAFCSSWYLTDILIPGDEPVRFEYTEGTIVDYTYLDETVYNYGKSLRVRDFDLDRYRSEVRKNLNNAVYMAKDLALSLKYSELADKADRLPLWVENVQNVKSVSNLGFPVNIIDVVRVPLIGMTIDYNAIISSHLLNRVTGVLIDIEYSLENISRSMTEIAGVLEIIERMNYSSSAAPIVSALKGCLNELLRLMRLSIERISAKGDQYIKDFSQQSIKEIGLKCITWGKNRIMVNRNDYVIQNIQLQNARKEVIKNIDFSYENRCLKGVAIGYDKTDMLGYYAFSYYLDTLKSPRRDAWGYCNGWGERAKHFLPQDEMMRQAHSYVQMGNVRIPSEITSYYNACANEEYTKAFSLKRISGSGGWNLDVDYELNEYSGEKYGGIRVKQIMLNDGNGNVDTVRYHYRDLSVTERIGSGVLICGYQTLTRELNYGSFKDIIYFSRVQDDEMAIVNKGNNGILYQYVVEEQVGNGYIAHYNLVPQSFRKNSVSSRSYFPYWLHGLPLATAVYDSKGRLIKLSKTRYSRSLLLSNSLYGIKDVIKNEYFAEGQVFPFSSQVAQLKPYRYAMNLEQIRRMLPDEEKPLYWNGSGYVKYNPYNDYYKPNVLPRENMIIPSSSYTLLYGGCVVPMEEVEYIFYDQYLQAVDTPSIADFTSHSFPLKYSETVRQYSYANPDRVTPTSVLTCLPDGREYKVVSKVVMDEFTGEYSSLVNEMREAHLLYFPVRTTTRFKPAGGTDFVLAGEEVTTYIDTVIGDTCYYFPEESWDLLLKEPENVVENDGYFTLERSRYSMQQRLRYGKFGNRIYVREKVNRGKSEVTLYDEKTGLPVFEARDTEASGVAAFSCKVEDELKYINLNNLPTKTEMEALKEFYDFHMNFSGGSKRDSFLWGETHREVMKIVRWILEDEMHHQNFMEEKDKRSRLLREYEQVWERNSRMPYTRNDYLRLVEITLEMIYLDCRRPELMSYALQRDEWVSSPPSSLQVESVMAGKYRYKLLVKKESKAWNKVVSWSFSETDNKDGERGFEIPAGSGFYCLEGDIDVLKDVSPVKLKLFTGTGVLAACVFPVYSSCNLYCYDSKGQMVCRVGANGLIDYREYDRNGRLTRVFDKDGFLLEEYDYHVNSNLY